jgi:tetratricopeptide (TPR) repeat protein
MRPLARLLVGLLLLLLSACAGTAPLAPKAVDLNRAGTEALAQGDLETAEARFALALEYHPRFVEALTNLGLVEMQRGNLELARTYMERARRINPDLAQPHHGLGVLFERMRRPDEAAEHYRQALKVNPGFGAARANLGRILFAAAQYDEAREQFLRLVESDKAALAGRTGLAETLLRLGRDNEADTVVEQALADFGDTPELTVLAARRELRRGALEKAEQMLVPLTAGHDDRARAAWSWIGAARLARGDCTGAYEAEQRALELDRNDPVATYVVAMALSASRDRRAEVWLERAHLLAPEDPVLEEELRRAGGRKTEPRAR